MNSGLQSGRGLSQPGQTTTLNIRPKILSCSPDFSLGIPTETLAVTTWAPSAGEVEVACPASLTQVGHHDLPQRPSWVGFSLCSQNHQAPAGPAPAQLRGGGVLARAEGSGPKDTPEKPKPGGRSLLMLELPVGGGIANAKTSQRVSFLESWKQLLYDIFQGRGKGHWLGLWQ